MNEYLRKEVKLTKAIHGIKYKQLADELKIKPDSLYNWLRGSYDLGEQKQRQLQEILKKIKEQ